MRGTLRREDLDPDPIKQFGKWFDYAHGCHSGDVNAVALATASAEGAPSVRMVLLKGFGPQGFVFSTNYRSRKGQDLGENPRAALLFFWEDLEQQIRIEGRVSRTSAEASDAIFYDRPVASRIASITSQQSRPIGSREELEAAFQANRERLGDDPPRPQHWGGFVLVPESIEFWQGGANRLHDRFVYRRAGDAWEITRLQP